MNTLPPEYEQLHWFLARAAETEEVWGLGDDAGWSLQEQQDSVYVTIFTDQAAASIVADRRGLRTRATSLDHFFGHLLPVMMDQDIAVEIAPEADRPGMKIPARDLHSVLESVYDSGEYFLEG